MEAGYAEALASLSKWKAMEIVDPEVVNLVRSMEEESKRLEQAMCCFPDLPALKGSQQGRQGHGRGKQAQKPGRRLARSFA